MNAKRHSSPPARPEGHAAARRGWWIGVVLLCVLAGMWPARPLAAAQAAGSDPVPLMAYYYIWFDPQSWERAKSDYPLLGRYSSDDTAVMRQHVRWAKDAGIDGFIVSWKSTFQLDSRLEKLMDIALEEDFRLWIIYQGLDFQRNPLPVSWIEADLDYFVQHYAAHPVFARQERPVVIWSGTWEFTTEEIDAVASAYRPQLTILASERSLEGYRRLAGIVEGNAYYWSSVDPLRTPGYQEKLEAMGQLVHRSGGLWVAPAAPGFDARLIGGTRLIERNNGETLRRELDAATRSSPDAIGLISWNEFSENTHIEPGERYGAQALAVLADVRQGVVPALPDFDSSAPGSTDQGNRYPVLVLAGTFVFMAGSLLVLLLRRSPAHLPGAGEMR